MKVGVWGSYSYGNYGDDVMALQFATFLKKLGAEPCVYRLDKKLAGRYSLNTTDSWDELFHNSKFCIIGGGGVLINNLTGSVDKEFQNLYQFSSSYNCPVFPISIGGEGRGKDAVLSSGRLKFFEGNTCQWSTVRLEDDVPLLNNLGKEAFYYPDVLLTVSDFWEIPPASKSNEQLQVGINIPDSFQGRIFAFQLEMIAKARKDVVFHFIPTYLPNSSVSWELLPKQDTPYIKRHTYTDPHSTLKFLSSLDLVISYKLHLGLTALAVGVPFYSLGGPGKAHAFLQSINANFAIWSANSKLIKLGLFLAKPENIRDARKKFDFAAIEYLKKQSWGHMERLQQLVSHYL